MFSETADSLIRLCRPTVHQNYEDAWDCLHVRVGHQILEELMRDIEATTSSALKSSVDRKAMPCTWFSHETINESNPNQYGQSLQYRFQPCRY